MMTTERIAVAAWDQAAGIGDPAAWHPQLVEIIDGWMIGDAWSGHDWPTGTAQGFLADWHAHARATHLVMLATGTGVYPETGERRRIRTVTVVGADGSAFALIAPVDDPTAAPQPVPTITGDLYAAMVTAVTPDDDYRDELEELGR